MGASERQTQRVLKEKPNIAREKLGWLNRHDKDCGSLYGMLPLVKNMPVALEDHLDRNPEKQLLRGESRLRGGLGVARGGRQHL